MKKITKISAILGCAGSLLAGGRVDVLAKECLTQTGFAMDTVVTEKIYSDDQEIPGEILRLLEDLDQSRLSWTTEGSEIFHINENGTKSVKISDEMAGWMKQILTLADRSEGAFDPTLGEVIRLWDIGGEKQGIPAEGELKALLENVGWQKISLSHGELVFLEETSLDLGAVGKGIGCDVVSAYLKEKPQVTGALINLGGSSVMTYGEKPDGSEWNIAVVDPKDPEGEYLGTVVMKEGEFLSTSGDYKKFFEENGVRYHHIFDPSTGYPAKSGLSAVTVIGKNGLEADGLSTACFVLGIEKGEKLLKEYGAQGLFVDEEYHIYMTEGMEERFHLLKTEYEETEF